jgi:hypothetical protein
MSAVLFVAVTCALYSAQSPAGAAESHHVQPAVTGNPAFDPNAALRTADPGRLLLSCSRPGESSRAEIYASAKDFDEGKQSFYLRRWNEDGNEVLYPLHGHFLDDGASGIFMVHDGKGTRQHDTVHIDQTVNMGLFLFRTTAEGPRAVVNIYAEDERVLPQEKDFEEMPCRSGDVARRLSLGDDHVRTVPNSGATPPSYWYGEADGKLLSCIAVAPTGQYQVEVLGSTIWPAHLAFVVVHAPGRTPVGYNVHLLEGPGRLLIHAHSYPHRTRIRTMDTMEETETVIGGLLLRKTLNGYSGWAGLVASSADPYNISFARDSTLADYASLGHAVIPPLRVSCQ